MSKVTVRAESVLGITSSNSPFDCIMLLMEVPRTPTLISLADVKSLNSVIVPSMALSEGVVPSVAFAVSVAALLVPDPSQAARNNVDSNIAENLLVI